MDLPDAGTKLRRVLDYLPCEACLADPVHDQELLCTICARLDRQVAIRVGVRRTVIVEHPSPSPAPVVIAPAVPVEAPPTVTPEPVAPAEHVRVIVTRFAEDAPAPERSIEVVVEPLAPPPAAVVVPLVAEPPIETAPAVAEEEEPAFNIDDIASYVPAFEEFFDYDSALQPRQEAPRAVEEPVDATPVPVVIEEAPPEDDFVFQAPPREEEPAQPEPQPLAEVDEDLIPEEEVPVVSDEREAQWAPPPDFLAEEDEAPVQEETERVEATPPVVEEEFIQETDVEEEILAPVEEPPVAEEPVEEDILETEVLEAEIVEDEPLEEPEAVLEMEIIEDEPAPAAPPAEPVVATGAGDLYRLRDFNEAAEVALGEAGIRELSHLSGHDAQDLAGRTRLPFETLRPWIQACDLYHEVGIPIEAANALVAVGIAGPRGLTDADADEVAARATAEGGHPVTAREMRRWKRRA